jgi:hypothetical protein
MLEVRETTEYQLENLKGRDQFVDVGADGITILHFILNKLGIMA